MSPALVTLILRCRHCLHNNYFTITPTSPWKCYVCKGPNN